ncbi:MAG: hypothetical protein JWM28_1865, partial [Chitinophagaceae bacterium]|nr:hypothetical protein [Chitinophagaceae bacterium]
ATHFVVAYPKQGSKATYDTEVRILYDQNNFYIFAHCDFSPGKKDIQVQDMRRDFSFSDNELFEVLIEPFKDPRLPVMTFCVTPYSTQMDVMHYADGSYDYKWDALWQAASQIQEDSWTTEIAIPFSSLRYPANSTEWTMNFVRNIRHLGEQSGWSAWPMAFNESRMEYAGIVTGIHPPKAKVNMRFEPYVLAHSSNTNTAKGNGKPTAGGELKYTIGTSTLLEGTINTDFAQADVDKQVINLTRSSVFFPENRQFFLENSSLFSVGQNGIIQPFFSRKIGLSDAGVPLTINGGLRLVHQDSHQSAGLLIMRQNGDSTENDAWFGVARYKRNLTSQLQLGSMAILRENAAGLGQRSYLNSVGVIDAFWRAGPSLFVRGMGSLSGNSLTRKNGTAFFSELNYATNSINFDWFETISSKNYEAQTGYVARTDFVNTQTNMGYLLHKNWFPKSLAFFNPQLTVDIYHQASTGNFQEANVTFIPLNFIFNNLGQLQFNMTSSWEHLREDFSPVRNISIVTGKYQFNRYQIYGWTNTAAPYGTEGGVTIGGYYNGKLNDYYISFRATPIPKISLIFRYTHNDFWDVGISKAAVTTHLLAPELRVAANPKLLFSAFYQYNTDAQNGSLNTRFSWEYKPLSFVYLVLNTLNNYDRKPFELPAQQRSGILKITYIRQL